jgi:hypothetical protein
MLASSHDRSSSGLSAANVAPIFGVKSEVFALKSVTKSDHGGVASWACNGALVSQMAGIPKSRSASKAPSRDTPRVFQLLAACGDRSIAACKSLALSMRSPGGREAVALRAKSSRREKEGCTARLCWVTPKVYSRGVDQMGSRGVKCAHADPQRNHRSAWRRRGACKATRSPAAACVELAPARHTACCAASTSGVVCRVGHRTGRLGHTRIHRAPQPGRTAGHRCGGRPCGVALQRCSCRTRALVLFGRRSTRHL